MSTIAENRIKTVDTTGATYVYGSGPLRLKRVAAGTTTRFIYAGTTPIAEYVNGNVSREYVYAGATLVATHSGSAVTFHHRDHLSTRVETSGSGNTVVRTFGHYPFGEAWYEGGTASNRKFTSYERESESALDYAVFRRYGSTPGRFLSADPRQGRTTAPQSLNRYTYVVGDPVNLLDPLGLDPCDVERYDPDECPSTIGQLLLAISSVCYDVYRDGFRVGNTCDSIAPIQDGTGNFTFDDRQEQAYWDCMNRKSQEVQHTREQHKEEVENLILSDIGRDFTYGTMAGALSLRLPGSGTVQTTAEEAHVPPQQTQETQAGAKARRNWSAELGRSQENNKDGRSREHSASRHQVRGSRAAGRDSAPR
jgi:RHS repeat-associated protein